MENKLTVANEGSRLELRRRESRRRERRDGPFSRWRIAQPYGGIIISYGGRIAGVWYGVKTRRKGQKIEAGRWTSPGGFPTRPAGLEAWKLGIGREWTAS